MISTIILLTLLGEPTQSTKVMKADVYQVVDIAGGKIKGCALLVKGIENDLLVSESCDQVREQLK